MATNKYHTDRLTLLRLLLGGIMVMALYYGWSQLLPHQLAGSKLFDISIDNTFWLFHLSGIPARLNEARPVLFMLEGLLLVLGLVLFKTGKPAVNVAFLLLFILLSLYIQTWSCILTKVSVLVPIILFPFCFKGPLFRFTWKFPRYYLVYLMVTAGLYKFTNLGIFYPGQMEHIIFNQHIDLMVSGSNHWSLKIGEFLYANPWLVTAGYWMIILVELCFIALLFTHKLNKTFSLIIVLFCISIWLTMRIYTFEVLFLILPLIQISPGND
ncbi:MAG: hypothetical protein GY751_04750 [Bacteroidetes bacterium]|nr:hypothetical protein [Bacteroidota bacterium]